MILGALPKQQGAGYATGVSNHKLSNNTTSQHFARPLIMAQNKGVLCAHD